MTRDIKARGGRQASHRSISQKPAGSGRLGARIRLFCILGCCALALQPSLLFSGRGSARAASQSRPATSVSLADRAAYSLLALVAAVGDGVRQLIPADGTVHRASVVPEAAYEPEPAAFLIEALSSLTVSETHDSEIVLTWPAVAGAASYRVERSPSLLAQYQVVGQPDSNTFEDTSTEITRGSTYLYRVRAVGATGERSEPSPVVMATAIDFVDPELIGAGDPNNRPATRVKAVHVNDLRLAVKGVRGAALLSTSWQGSAEVSSGDPVMAEHVRELRSKLDQGLAALGLPVNAYEDSQLNGSPNGSPIRKRHFEQLRERSTRGTGVTGSGISAYDFATERLDPHNRTGGGGMDLYSGNFNWSIPIVSLPGRAGLDLGLSLSYNSLVWTRSGNYMLFDGDWGWPAPGFRLGFPIVQGQFYDTQAQKLAYMMVTPSGARVSLRQTATPTVFEAGDSSYLQLTEKQDGSLELFTTDGTRMTFRVQGGVYKCTEVRDRNGNFMTAAYDVYGKLDAVTDTLGRVIDFDYYSDGYLKQITQTWHRGVEGSSTVTETHRWAKFDYDDPEVRVNFPEMMVFGPAGGQTFHALKKVTLADDSSFTFNYTSWGQVYQIEGRAKSNGLLNRVKLDLPLDQTEPQGDCPRPSARRDWAAYANGDTDGASAQPEELTTLYSIADGATWVNPDNDQSQTGRLGQMTSPDGTIYKEYTHSSSWDEGLVRLAQVWSGGKRKKWTSTAWTQDSESLPHLQNPRVRETSIYDYNEDETLRGRRRTEVVYTAFGLPQEVKEYDSNATDLLRLTRTEYVPGSVNQNGAYTVRRIIGLPSKREVFGIDDQQETLFSKVTYDYDLGGEFLAAPEGNPASVAQHDGVNFGTGFTVRGNLCRVRRWDVSTTANANDQSKSVASEAGYNTLGSAILSRDALGHQTTVSYIDSDGGTRYAYPTAVTDPGGFTSSAWYNYDMGVVTKTETPKPQGANEKPVVTRHYDAVGRPLKVSAGPGGTYTKWEYGAGGLFVKQLTKVDSDKAETFVLTVADGAGGTVGVLREHPGEGTGYAASRTEYDPINRVMRRYNPVEVSVDTNNLPDSGAWVPAGPDATPQGRDGWPYSATEYDWKGRVRRAVNADGSDRLTDYEGCGCAGGEAVTMQGELVPIPGTTDSGRRTQKVYHDIFGRPRRTEMLDWDGSVYSSTTTRYDALDRVLRVREYAGAVPVEEPTVEGEGYQTTTMTYDGHGRLKTQHLPKYTANAVTTFEYNNDDTVQSVTDPRGVIATFTYNSRHLTELVAYNPAQSGAPDTPDLVFGYDGAGNRASMTDEAGSVTYEYDPLSRLTSETRQFNGITHRTYMLTYAYTLAGQLKSMTDPFGVITTYGRDKVGRVTDVTGSGYPAIAQLTNGVQFASGIKYSAWGAVNEASYGDGRGMTADYDSRLRVTGFQMSGSLTMNKSYQYEADGGLRFAADQLDHTFDRSYTYDHAGMLAEAHTGEQARGGTTDDGPYQQSYTYDPFGHNTGQYNVLWKQVVGGGSGEYKNDRRQGWNYDAAGNITYDGLRHYVNDAVGRMRSFGSGIQTYAYDGNGEVARVTRQLEGTSVVYNLRSTALGGEVVSQLKPQSNALDARQDIIPIGDGAEARRDVMLTGEIVTWSHEDPAGTTVQEGGVSSFGGANATFLNPMVQLDPVGASVGWADPAQFEEPPAPPDETSPEMPVYSNPLRPGQGCSDNLIVLPCEQVLDNWRVNGTRTYTLRTESVLSFRVTFAGSLSWATDEGDVKAKDGESVNRMTQHLINYYSIQRERTSVMEAARFSGYSGGKGMGTVMQPQQTGDPCIHLVPGVIPSGRNVDENIRITQNEVAKLRRAAQENANLIRSIGEPGAAAAAGGAALAADVPGGSIDIWFKSMVADQKPWDYKYLDPERERRGESIYEDFGNFNYGATGAAAGYSLGVLQRMAGWVQNYKPEGVKTLTEIEARLGVGGVYPYGDQRRDAIQIERGFAYYNCRQANPRR